MKTMNIVKRSLLTLAVIPAVLVASGNIAMAAQIPYAEGDYLDSPSTPAFNIYTGVPFGVGNEADFVRIRTSNGNPIDSGNTGERNSLYTTTLSTVCNNGDMFDVRTYIHNGADDDYNYGGQGSAVAHGVELSMTALLGTEAKNFPFNSTISADNADTVTDDANLVCANNVKLELVPKTVKVYTATLGWMELPVTVVNGKTTIGNHDMNSGDVWGCWNERIQVVYTVKVVNTPVVPPVTPPVTPQVLPSTGAGSTIAIFAATSFVGAMIYRAKLLRSVR